MNVLLFILNFKYPGAKCGYSVAFNPVPQPAATTFASPSVWFLFNACNELYSTKGYFSSGLIEKKVTFDLT